MATGTNIRTWHEGRWHDADVAIMRAADHGSWLGTTVFDGARRFEGVTPDLDAHCARVNRSAEALMITPTVEAADMVEIVREGSRRSSLRVPRGPTLFLGPGGAPAVNNSILVSLREGISLHELFVTPTAPEPLSGRERAATVSTRSPWRTASRPGRGPRP